jgi:hypothetical protein
VVLTWVILTFEGVDFIILILSATILSPTRVKTLPAKVKSSFVGDSVIGVLGWVFVGGENYLSIG